MSLAALHPIAHLPLALAAVALAACVAKPPETVPATVQSMPDRPLACDNDDGGLALPPGFCAGIVADNLPPVRQLAVAPNGVLYAAFRRGPSEGGGVVALRDVDGDGEMDDRETFGEGRGNDVAVRAGYLYFAADDRIVRWRLGDATAPAGEPEVIVSGLPVSGSHIAKSIAFRGDTLFVNVGSASNACQERDRVPGSKGDDPCRELEERAGIWAFDADTPGQRFAAEHRYATGLRNAMALAVEPSSGRLFAAVHGRDQLGDNWGFSPQRNATNPAEELVIVERGADYGWPYCYQSTDSDTKVLAPEYGGDGDQVGRCAAARAPVLSLPAHWAPMALEFYSDTAFGTRYHGGAFIAMHGSWNRAPLPEEGYRVVFLPFRDGSPTGEVETFAIHREGVTRLRAAGVAVAPDGSLYISADRDPTIWRVVRLPGPRVSPPR
ncbi:MAG: PQQ-dependent sugar dehydrogenase [Gemmatimonadota bacterium]|nr:PQQ-dependent sugar dehydrogenase [Gemmatimonadota bacterium]